MSDNEPTRTRVDVSIHGSEPPYRVLLNPAGPYRITAAGSTVTMTLDSTSAAAGFRLYGIGFRNAISDSQLTAEVSTTRSPDDTLTVTDAYTEKGQFEFVMLYQDAIGGSTVYGLDPEIDNEEP
ncbi:MAG: hypothetical protein V2J10_02855 [Wenzhouxiangella sp.]|jgi:hypothetical protein|nr:hypothetical protein [Wenzhouxiangella sp.]